MTIGELARLFNDRFLEKKVNLTVIPMQGWKMAGLEKKDGHKIY